MIRVDIEAVMLASGPVPSMIVLRERSARDTDELSRSLSIQTGAIEAATISRGIDGSDGRPLAHDLYVDTMDKLGAKIERVVIERVEAPVFYANVVLLRNGEEISIDARPSDALSLAVRANAPIFVDEDLMNRLGTVSRRDGAAESSDEFERFDAFAQSVSPDDF